MSRRSRLDMYIATLAEIKSGTKLPTRIMFGANLSWVTLQKILERLIINGFIENQQIEGNNKTKNLYTITDKGNHVFGYITRINEIIDINETIEIPI